MSIRTRMPRFAHSMTRRSKSASVPKRGSIER